MGARVHVGVTCAFVSLVICVVHIKPFVFMQYFECVRIFEEVGGGEGERRLRLD